MQLDQEELRKLQENLGMNREIKFGVDESKSNLIYVIEQEDGKKEAYEVNPEKKTYALVCDGIIPGEDSVQKALDISRYMDESINIIDDLMSRTEVHLDEKGKPHVKFNEAVNKAALPQESSQLEIVAMKAAEFNDMVKDYEKRPANLHVFMTDS
ncbi:MAG: hypothetical protein Q8O89_05845 [Nanoarchaeota archaeon]|nr:hypothetical protein [Nanoarchaeota archaeon]